MISGGEVYELVSREVNRPRREPEKIASLSAEAVLSKAISRASKASLEGREGTWEVSLLPQTKGGFAEHLYTVIADNNRSVTVEVAP